MSPTIKSILEEIYLLEPRLREKEEKIIKIIEKMQANRPDIQIDDAFKAELKKKILAEIRPSISGWNWGWVLAGFSTTAFAAFAVYTFLGGFSYEKIPLEGISDRPLTTVTPPSHLLSFAPSVVQTDSNAFGKISLTGNVGQLGTPQAVSAVAPMARGMGGGGVSVENAKMTATDAMTMPAIDFPYYTYVYTGSVPSISGSLMVYKKNPSGFTSAETSSFLSNFAIDGINLSAFGNKNLSNLSFVEDQDFGYSVNLDFQNGNISIYQNWSKWPQIKCDANGCEQPPKITENDIPSEEDLIRIADTFLATYNINRSLYGSPKVDSSWRIMYARAEKENLERYIPEQYNVTYPIILDEKSVYEEYGGYKGITLTIDIRTKRVVGLYGLEKQNLMSSVYTNLISEDALRKMIPHGGRYETKPYGEQKTVEVRLGEPVIQYVHVYGEWKDGKSDEYYVPAYVFPVLDKPEGSYLRDSIIIPVVADFATFVPYTDTPIAVPLPAVMEKAVGE